MHDDLGAGLSRIKFLSQSILNKKLKDDVHKELKLGKNKLLFLDELSGGGGRNMGDDCLGAE
jgi:hypothetical protein